MIARYAGASLALLAFTIVVCSGLLVQNPITVTLSRALFALFVFLILGMVLGGAAQMVVNEHRRHSMGEIERRYRTTTAPDAAAGDRRSDRPATTEGGAVGS